MKALIRTMLVVILAVIALPTLAQSTSTSSAPLDCASMVAMMPMMTSNAQSVVKTQCASELSNSGITTLIENVDEISKIGVVAKDIAMAIGIAAKELGIAVNDFLDSPAGIITAGLITWNYIGDDLYKIIVGLPLMLICFGIYVAYWRRMFTAAIEIKEVARSPITGLLFGPTKFIQIKTHRPMTQWSEGEFVISVIMTIALVLSILILA